MHVRVPVLLCTMAMLSACAQPMPVTYGLNEPVLNVDPALRANIAAA